MTLFAWLLTYLIHSTVLLGLVWLVTRRRRVEPAVADLLWKVALIAGLVTGTIQARLQVSPPAAVMLPVAALPAGQPVSEPAAPATQAPETPGFRPGSANQTPSRTASLPLVLVQL